MPFPIANISQGAPANGTTERAVDAKSRTSMDKDAFLKLLIAQISNQDPMQPMQGTEYMQQLTQFAMVEQAQTQSAKLETISAQLTGLSSNEAASLIGKTVSIKGRGIAYDGLLATGGGVTLADKSAKVTVQILNPEGKPVRTMEMGAREAGAMSVMWDGKDDWGNRVPAGNYSMDVKAYRADGTAVNVDQTVTGTVSTVSYEKGYPELQLNSGVHAPISDLVSVSGPSTSR